MGIKTKPKVELKYADTSTPFDVTLSTPATAEDLVTVPSLKKGRAISIVNEGPGDAVVAFDATATASDLLLKEGDAYDDQMLEVSTKVSFINVTTGEQPRLRGILWSGD